MAVLTSSETTPTALDRPSWLRGLSVATLVANMGIILTGALVRLTSSGLGCPTWPRCDATSYTTRPALGIHGAIEFGNRLLTFVLLAIVVLTLISAWRYREGGRSRHDLRWLAAILVFGIPLQGVIGGISVLTELNPFVVALHLLASMGLVAVSVWLVRLVWHAERRPVPGRLYLLTRVTFVALWLAVWMGTLVTGSGPHAGDASAPRTGFSALTVTHVHTSVVYLTVALTIACLAFVRNKAGVWLLLILAVQAGIGFIQYYTGLPIGVVLLHLLGAASAMALGTNLLLSVSRVKGRFSAVR